MTHLEIDKLFPPQNISKDLQVWNKIITMNLVKIILFWFLGKVKEMDGRESRDKDNSRN